MIPIDFQVTCSKVKVKPLFSAHCVVCSISFDPFTWSISNLVQGLPSEWVDDPYWFSGHMFKGQGQTTVLSAQYLLIPCLLASDRFCFYREDKPEFCTKGGIYMFLKHFLFIWITLHISSMFVHIHLYKCFILLKTKTKTKKTKHF